MLTIDIDVGDKRMTSAHTIKNDILSFVNTLNLEGEPYHFCFFCLNCGGFVEPKDVVE